MSHLGGKRTWTPGAQRAAAPFGTAAHHSTRCSLVKRVRDVVESGIQLVADALHGTDRGNGNESCDQTVFNGGRALTIFNQLQKPAHVHLRPRDTIQTRATVGNRLAELAER